MFFPLVLACKDSVVFTQCIQDVDNFVAATCPLVQQRNTTWGLECQCLGSVHKSICYNQCPNDAEAQNIRNASVDATSQILCSAANIDPKAVPLPVGAWYTRPPTTSTATAKPTAGAVEATQKSGTTELMSLSLFSLSFIATFMITIF